MRYFCYIEPGAPETEIITVSEEEIRQNYYPYWKSQMIEKVGEEVFEKNYSFPDCLDDWIVVNWAWESTTDPSGDENENH